MVLYPRLAPPGAPIVSGEPTVLPSNRKFIVLRGPQRCVVAIGPDWDAGAYYHADLLKAAQGEFPDLAIRGGGHLRVTQDPMDGAKAWFHGRSTAFGVFDPVLRTTEVRLMLTRAMRCVVAVA